jgi:hypothetical protein
MTHAFGVRGTDKGVSRPTTGAITQKPRSGQVLLVTPFLHMAQPTWGI